MIIGETIYLKLTIIRQRNFGNAKPAKNLLFSEEAKCVKVKSRSIPRTIHFPEFCD